MKSKFRIFMNVYQIKVDFFCIHRTKKMIQIRVGQKVKNLTPMPLSRKLKILRKTKDFTSLNLKWRRHELINYRSANRQPKVPKILANS